MARGAEYGERAIALASEPRMAPVAWLAHSTLGALLRHHADTAAAGAHLQESLRIADAIGAQALQSWPLAALSDLSRCNGDLAAALAYGDRAVAIDRAYGQHGLLPRSLMFAALAHHMLGDATVAREYADEALEMLRALRKQEIRIWSAVYASAAALALEGGDALGAMREGDGLLAHLEAHGWPALYVLDPFALPLRVEAAIRAGELDDAGLHLARLHELADRWSHGPATAAYHHLDALLASAKGEAMPDAFDEALRRYATLGLRPAHGKVLLDKGNLLESLGRHDEAVAAFAEGLRAASEMQAAPLVEAFAAAQRAAGIKTRAPRKPGGVLTERETEVAELASRGLTNREIAESLSISLLTAETHVRNILRKSGLRSRAQLASYVP
jgi:DNA-binding CsgD family transcriptional regulator